MSIQSDLEGVPDSADSDEKTLAKLLQLDALELHTTVEKPDPMTALDIYGEYSRKALSPGVADLIGGYQHWKRKNMTAFKGNRGSQIVEAIKAKVEEKRNKSEAMALSKAVR